MKKNLGFFIIGFCSLLLYGFLVYLDAFEAMSDFFEKYEKYELDELFLILPVYALGLSAVTLIKQIQLKRANTILRKEISSRKSLEIKLRDSEYLLSNHLKNTPIAAVQWDLEFKIKEWNPAAEKLFGYKRKEVLGKNIMKLLVQENSEKIGRKIVHDLTNSDVGLKTIFISNTKTGKPVLCHWSNTLLRNRFDAMVGVASLIIKTTRKTKRIRD